MGQTARVLVIDDDDAVLDLLRQKLSPHFTIIMPNELRRPITPLRRSPMNSSLTAPG